jgi:hypothetical protein
VRASIPPYRPHMDRVSRRPRLERRRRRPWTSLKGRTALFEGGDAANPTRITFKSPDAATLNITVERRRNGAPVSTEFKYRRIAP